MSTRHMSLRIDDDTFQRLDNRSRQLGQSRTHLASTLIEEGLRMDAHPGIVFRPGPTGRRPALAAGPDVWEIIRVLKDFQGEPDDAIERTAELASLSHNQVRTALRYYSEYQCEIDAWIDRLEEETARAEAAWQRERAALQR